MPDYPAFRSVPSVLEFMQSMDQQRADMQKTAAQIPQIQADTQLLNIKSLLGQQQYTAEQQRQQATDEYRKWMRQQDAMGDPSQPNPSTPSVSEKQQPSWLTPVDQSVMDLTKMRDSLGRQYSKAQQLDLTDEVKTLRPILDNTVTRLREAQKEQADQRNKQFEQTANMLNNVKSAEQVTTAMDYIKQKMPPQVWSKADDMLLHNPDGSYLWNDQQAARVAQLGAMHTSVANQNSAMHADLNLILRKAELERGILRDQETKDYHDAITGRKQGGTAGGGEGGPGGVGSQILQDSTGKKYAMNNRSGKAWVLGDDGEWTQISANDVPSDVLKPGTSAAAKSGSINIAGGRESVFVNRVVQATRQATKDIENIAKIPLEGQTTGLFGGRTQGRGLFEANKEVLAQKLTSQDAQRFNVISTGLVRSLAQIETAGVAQGIQEFSKTIDVVAKEGDTQLTKLHKMAQMRQIIDAAAESTIANERVPQGQRDLMLRSQEEIHKAIPFTHSDLIEMESRQVKDPRVTLRDVLPKITPKGSAETATAPTAVPRADIKLQGATPKTLRDTADQMERDAGIPVGSASKGTASSTMNVMDQADAILKGK